MFKSGVYANRLVHDSFCISTIGLFAETIMILALGDTWIPKKQMLGGANFTPDNFTGRCIFFLYVWLRGAVACYT